MKVDAYLDRIRYDGPRAKTAETLRQLHQAHMLSVPFENLDIRFGDSCLSPLRVDPGLDDEQSGSGCSIAHADGTWTVRRRRGGVWEPQYIFFSLTRRRLDEFAARNRFQQTAPASHFTRSTICSLTTHTGRISLSGRRLIVTTGDRREDREVRSVEEYRSILVNERGIDIGEPEAPRLMTSGSGP
jgi:N-hydroxyarylamine O-acetyltransferase